MQQTASWKLPTVIQNIMLNQCLKTVHQWSPFRAKELPQGIFPSNCNSNFKRYMAPKT